MNILFGDYIKQKRFEKGLSLRKFCEEMELDPSNWSKIERGYRAAPTDKEVIKKICDKLKLDLNYVYDLAKISVGKLPEYSEEDFLKKLPVLFSKRPTKKQLDEIANLIKSEFYKNDS